MHKVKITITGRKVHNVGYRLYLLDEAEGRFIPHFDARNVKIKGKQVVVAIAGGDEETVMDFVEYVKSAPHESASVSSIEVEGYDGNIRTTDSFRNSFSTHQLFKIANIGVKMLEKQDETISVIRDEGERTRTELSSVIRDEGEKTRTKLSSVISDEGEKTRDALTKHLTEDIKELRQEIVEIKATLSMVLEKVEA
jgi:acylphosphatase